MVLFDSVRRAREDQRTFAGVLGGVMYLASGVVLLATLSLLPDLIDRTPLVAMGVLAMLSGVGLMALPWSRWPRWVPAVLVVVAQINIAVAGVAAPGSVSHYLPLYVLSYLYVGMTLPPWSSAAVVPLTVASFVVGRGFVNDHLVNFVIALPIAVTAAEVLSRLLARLERHRAAVDQVLDLTRRLPATSSVDDAATLIGDLTAQLTASDLVTVMVVDADQPSRFVARMRTANLADLGEIAIDINTESTGVAVALRSAAVVVVPDAKTSPIVSRRYVDATGVGAVIYAPLFDGATAIGAIAAGWRRAGRPHTARVQHLELLAAQAGPQLARLLEHYRLSTEAEHDPLTGLSNRRVIDRAFARALPGDAVVMLDMDHFKSVNDDLGHAVGDETLRQMAACLLRSSREVDAIGRYGGEEFAAVLPGAGESGALSFLRRVRATWAKSQPITTFSAGYAVLTDDESAAAALARADHALYRAKDRGRDRDEAASNPAAAVADEP